MNSFSLEIWDDEGIKTTFYTVKWDDCDESETDKFFKKFFNMEAYKSATQELLGFLVHVIGLDYGAKDEFFNRYEHEVVGLPSRGKVSIDDINYHYPNFPLRLYALKVSDDIVILFNGGIKDGRTNKSSSLHLKWIEACQFAKKIDRAIRDQDIVVDESLERLTWYDGTSDMIL